jgi:hypothetical protein
MSKRLSALLLLALAACSGDPPTDPGNGVATVNVNAPASFVGVGDTIRLTATVVDGNGATIPAAVVEWSSSQPTVATVNSSGTVVGQSPGTTTITARYGSATATVLIDVDAGSCSGDFSLSVGEVRQVRGGAALGCITLAPSVASEEYVYIIGNARAAQDDMLRYTATLTNTSAVQAAVAPRVMPAVQDQAAVRSQTSAQKLEERLRAYERSVTSDALPNTQRRRERPETGATLAVQAVVRDVGDTVTIRVPNLQDGKDICRDFLTVRAVVRAVSARATMLEDVASPPGKLTLQDYQDIAREFDDLIFPTDTLWFGSPTDLNSDQRISILYTPEVNKLTPSGSTGIVGGFFFGGDLIRRNEYPTSNDCRNQTNEQEIFYILAPDPNGTINGNARTTDGVRQVTRGTIAHEFQHMINQSVRQYNPAVKAFETAWLNEGMSHFAEEAVGRALRGFGDFQSLNQNDINPNPNAAGDYQAFFRQNQNRFLRWAQRPDTSSPTSNEARDQLAARGAAWALLRWVADHYSNGNARSFFRRLAVGPETDIPNLLLRAGNRPFDELVGGWLTANYADNRGIPNLAVRYSYISWDMPNILAAANNNTPPLLVNTFPGTYTSQALSGSGNYYLYQRPANSGPVTLDLRTSQGQPLTNASARVWILRTR